MRRAVYSFRVELVSFLPEYQEDNSWSLISLCPPGDSLWHIFFSLELDVRVPLCKDMRVGSVDCEVQGWLEGQEASMQVNGTFTGWSHRGHLLKSRVTGSHNEVPFVYKHGLPLPQYLLHNHLLQSLQILSLKQVNTLA